METPLLVTGAWKLSDLKSKNLGSPFHGLTVFSCFHCGGGSSMGYKLAGFNVMGGVEIDPEMMKLYRTNHSPIHSYLMGVQDFKNIPNDKLPSDLFDIDVLDGSPPCSSFSISGDREDRWGDQKKFREGQAHQVLDDLFFHFIDIATKLKPKVVVAENVRGLVMGLAKGYVKEIFAAFRKAGYECQLFLLNSSRMGVPQARERTFFIARRADLNLPEIELNFNEDLIPVGKAFSDLKNQKGEPLSKTFLVPYEWCLKHNQWRLAEYFLKCRNKNSFFNHIIAMNHQPASTQMATNRMISHDRPERLSDLECVRLQSFPDDYNFLSVNAGYVCGMSVPPLMMQRVATEIAKQFFKDQK